MEKYLSIRCIKMQSVRAPVMLYREFGGSGFNLLCEEFTHIEKGLAYVVLEDVKFVIFEDRKKIMKETGVRTVHAVALGNLIKALPTEVSIPKKQIKFIETLPEIDYDPNDLEHFYYSHNKQIVTEAKELFAWDNKVRIQV